jgi:hypothetical protein
MQIVFKLTIAHIEQTQCFSPQRQQKGFSLDNLPAENGQGNAQT